MNYVVLDFTVWAQLFDYCLPQIVANPVTYPSHRSGSYESRQTSSGAAATPLKYPLISACHHAIFRTAVQKVAKLFVVRLPRGHICNIAGV